MDSAKNGFLCLNYGWFWLKTETKSGQTAIFVEIHNIIFPSEANFCEQNSYKFTQSHGLRFFYSLLSSLPQPIFLFDARCQGVDTAAGIEKLGFSENSLTFRLRQQRIANKLENFVCDHDKP